MAAELIPLESPELGMTTAELVMAYYAAMENVQVNIDRFFTLLFAYVAAAYFVAAQLTRIQWGVANALYIASIGYAAYFAQMWTNVSSRYFYAAYTSQPDDLKSFLMNWSARPRQLHAA
ncbi:MAG: hypothetical protein V2I82_01485 [Halieaceae bacterium]|jgi:hypothetical protein|nr:hypothetical protein [Halieaceae bacterium]